MDAGEASPVGIGTRQEIAGLDAVPGPGEMETLEGTAEGELGLQVAVLGLQALDLGFQIVNVRLGLSGGFRSGSLGGGELIRQTNRDGRRGVPARTGGPRSREPGNREP